MFLKIRKIAIAAIIGLIHLSSHADVIGVNDANSPLSTKRIDELKYLVKQDCGSCHGMLFKGGLGPALLPKNLSPLTKKQVADIILYGMPATAMPPWQGILSKQEAMWIARSLKTGSLLNKSSSNINSK